jgi:hypothetical protein
MGGKSIITQKQLSSLSCPILEPSLLHIILASLNVVAVKDSVVNPTGAI